MAGRGTEQFFWGLIYAVLALAPVAFLAAAPETEDSADIFLAVAIGFVALTMLALQVVLASRAPALTAVFGIDRLIRIHRAGGIAVLGLVAAHVVTVVGSEDEYGEWLHPLEAPHARGHEDAGRQATEREGSHRHPARGA